MPQRDGAEVSPLLLAMRSPGSPRKASDFSRWESGASGGFRQCPLPRLEYFPSCSIHARASWVCYQKSEEVVLKYSKDKGKI